jgi:SAM-dependent methyltransferase
MESTLMAIHQSARGFDAAAGEYERGRPGFPVEATDFLAEQLCLAPGNVVLDIGAGTGKLTRALRGAGSRVIALEPLEGMRNQLAALLPGTWIVGGVAEHLPLPSRCADAAVAGNAFHWFANRSALAEIHRVLKPAGRLALIWTWVDESVDWVGELSQTVDRYQGNTPRHTDGGWKSALEHFGGFRNVGHQCFHFVLTGDFEIIRNHVLSVSYIAKMAGGEQKRVVEEARNLIATYPATHGGSLIELPYRTDLYIYQARE